MTNIMQQPTSSTVAPLVHMTNNAPVPQHQMNAGTSNMPPDFHPNVPPPISVPRRQVDMIGNEVVQPKGSATISSTMQQQLNVVPQLMATASAQQSSASFQVIPTQGQHSASMDNLVHHCDLSNVVLMRDVHMDLEIIKRLCNAAYVGPDILKPNTFRAEFSTAFEAYTFATKKVKELQTFKPQCSFAAISRLPISGDPGTFFVFPQLIQSLGQPRERQKNLLSIVVTGETKKKFGLTRLGLCTSQFMWDISIGSRQDGLKVVADLNQYLQNLLKSCSMSNVFDQVLLMFESDLVAIEFFEMMKETKEFSLLANMVTYFGYFPTIYRSDEDSKNFTYRGKNVKGLLYLHKFCEKIASGILKIEDYLKSDCYLMADWPVFVKNWNTPDSKVVFCDAAFGVFKNELHVVQILISRVGGRTDDMCMFLCKIPSCDDAKVRGTGKV